MSKIIRKARCGVKAINPKVRNRQEIKKQVFRYFAPAALDVFLTGSFNDWEVGKTPMKKDAEGNWEVALSLPPGRYEYRFFVDGDWQNDQQPGECVPNAFGTWNCVLQVH